MGQRYKIMWVLLPTLFVLTMSSVQAQELTEVNSSDILEKIEGGEDIHIEKARILGEFNLSKINLKTITKKEEVFWGGNLVVERKIIESEIYITNSVFENDVDFRNANFNGSANFNDVNFNGSANFDDVKFNSSANFKNVNFNEYASFFSANFNSIADFNNSNFNSNAGFFGANFNSIADFNNATFNGIAYFYYATFNYNAYFNNATFNGIAYFYGANFSNTFESEISNTNFFGKNEFFNTNFIGNADFSYVNFNGNVQFDFTNFNNNSTFTNVDFNGNIYFNYVNFSGNANFNYANFNSEARFNNANFNNNAEFKGINSILFVEFIGADFNKVDFTHAKFDRVYFSNTKFSEIRLHQFDFNYMNIEWASLEKSILFDGPTYIKLIQNFNYMEQFEDADDANYQYRRIKQSGKKISFSWASDVMALITCGYGVRPFNTIIISFMAIMVFSLIYWNEDGISRLKENELNSYQEVSLSDAFYFSVSTFTNAGYGDWYPKDHYRKYVIVEGILGWLFLALLVVTLANVMIKP